MSVTNYDPAKYYPSHDPKDVMPCAEHWEKWIDEHDADHRFDDMQTYVITVSRKTLRLMLKRIPEAFVSLSPYTEEELKRQRLDNGCSE